MLNITILTSEEMAELQELVDGLTKYNYTNKSPDIILLPKEMLYRIAEILGLEISDD